MADTVNFGNLVLHKGRDGKEKWNIWVEVVSGVESWLLMVDTLLGKYLVKSSAL